MTASSFDDLAAALRARIDVGVLGGALIETLAAALPASLLEVDHGPGRFRRRGPIRRLAVRTGDDVLVVTVSRDGTLRATVEHVVRGVTLSRRPLPLAEWLDELAGALVGAAEQDAAARDAIERFLTGR